MVHAMTATPRWVRWSARANRPKALDGHEDLALEHSGELDSALGAEHGVADLDAAEEFLWLYHAEHPTSGPLEPRLRAVRKQISNHGTYWQTPEELAFGARVAWRNSSRCIGRLYWRSLRVRDLRHLSDAGQVAAESIAHLREVTNGGRIRPMITVFAPDAPHRPGPRILNEQLIRYAGYRYPDGSVVGDPQYVDFTHFVRELGWPGGPGTPFDVLPLAVQCENQAPKLFAVPDDAILEVLLHHPQYPWFADLGLRWHAVPAISDMCLEIGGLCYPAAPFNGWYMGTEIGARNLTDVDRYNLLPLIARMMGLAIEDERTLWRDRALVELNVAVLHSFGAAGVSMTDHHTESRRFLQHLWREEQAGRRVPTDWTWIVPPMSGATTPVFHRYYDDVAMSPRYVRRPPTWHRGVQDATTTAACPLSSTVPAARSRTVSLGSSSVSTARTTH
jgi:nitric-oxide synthase, bacterial